VFIFFYATSAIEDDDLPVVEVSSEKKPLSRGSRSFYTTTGLKKSDAGQRMLDEYYQQMKSKI
jgi:hypothetical protein